ncbi:MAG: ASKHA domain-containing protein [Candidatus Methanomethylicia archaeon]|nr:ASKHA domain-containing protein [Candidatus Methanomethylicia archaeon]MCX8168919.1 ASKHA domain-containing protein [Candidatus Methanomethylicia archaeon]MDW7988651.1 ASKHA domain-containing protein [Nitrososphaerota archaeon]
MEYVKVFFPQYKVEISIDKGTKILEAIHKANIGIRSICGGKGLCGKCKVIISRGRVKHEVKDKELISSEDISKGYVLACLAKIVEDIEVLIPPESIIGKAKLLIDVNLPKFSIEPYIHKIQIKMKKIEDLNQLFRRYLMDNELQKKIIDEIEIGKEITLIVDSYTSRVLDYSFRDFKHEIYGLAIDIGTTKIVASLINTFTSEILVTESKFNKQLIYGEDLISRISYALEKENGLRELQHAIIQTINEIIDDICKKLGINHNNIYIVSTAGNTVMTYTFIGLDPSPLIKSFKERVNVSRKPYIINSKDLGLKVNDNAIVYVLPCVGRFLGGDVIGDIITSEMNFSSKPTLLIDIGTNTEVVIGCKDWMLGTTAPAGPAFEGWGLKCGVRAIEGAIESMDIEPETLEPQYKVIGDSKPIGICGSGYIDLLAELFKHGIIDPMGKFKSNLKSSRIKMGYDGYEYIVAFQNETATNREIVITEKDIYNLIDAKSSVCAAISILLKKMMLNVYDIDKVYICGAFGKYLNINNAIVIGMIPEFVKAEIIFIGNGSLGGAYLSIASKKHREEAERIAKITASIELMLDPDFMEEYQAGFILPGRKDLFPTWWEISRKIIKNKFLNPEM